MARQRFPGQRNSLDALCKRLGVDNSHRQLHGALLDAQLLAEVYLALTSGQERDWLRQRCRRRRRSSGQRSAPTRRRARPRVQVSADELAAHEARLEKLRKKAGKVRVGPVHRGRRGRSGAAMPA